MKCEGRTSLKTKREERKGTPERKAQTSYIRDGAKTQSRRSGERSEREKKKTGKKHTGRKTND